MPVTATHLTTAGSATEATSYATASISPSANKLVILAVHNKVFSGTPNTPTTTGASMTWTQIATRLASADGTMRVTLFRSLSASPGSGALTIDCGGQTQYNCMWSISEFGGVVITGTNGADAVVQSASNDSNSVTSITATLAAFGNSQNATFGAGFGWNAGTSELAPGTGFTQLGEGNAGAGTNLTEWRVDNDTSVDVSRSDSADFMDIMAIEIKANPTGGAALFGAI